jgi:hypothetical protein
VFYYPAVPVLPDMPEWVKVKEALNLPRKPETL